MVDTEKKDASDLTPTKEVIHAAQGEMILPGDGVVLNPQAVNDALDPLNWSSFQKHTILAIIMAL